MNFLDISPKNTIKFHGHPSTGSRDVPGGRTDEQTTLTKQTIAFRNLGKVSEIKRLLYSCIFGSYIPLKYEYHHLSTQSQSPSTSALFSQLSRVFHTWSLHTWSLHSIYSQTCCLQFWWSIWMQLVGLELWIAGFSKLVPALVTNLSPSLMWQANPCKHRRWFIY